VCKNLDCMENRLRDWNLQSYRLNGICRYVDLSHLRRVGRVPLNVRNSKVVEGVPNEAGYFSGNVDHGENEGVLSLSDSDRILVSKLEANDHLQCLPEQFGFFKSLSKRVEQTQCQMQQFH
jgi:hypothetical protein